MLGVALAVASSALHATWNLIVKRSGTAQITYVWAYSALIAPVALVACGWSWTHGGGRFWWAGVVSALIHVGYALAVQKAYTVADLGVVYPISRGAAPAMVALIAVPVLGEPLRPPLVIGLVLVAVGVALTSARGAHTGSRWPGLVAGLLVAVATTAYTLWDGWSMSKLGAGLIGYLGVATLTQPVLTGVLAWPKRAELPGVLRTHWRDLSLVAVLVPFTYGLVLAAMALTPTSIVAAARSASIAFTVVFAGWLLKERQTRRQRLGAAVIIAGVVIVSLGTSA